MPDETPSFAVSVVLATRNRADALARTLAGIATQRAAPPFEVIVADNGSTDRTEAVVAAASRSLPVRRIAVPQKGKGRALNAAIRAATGELLVFTDDDVDPAPNWLAELHDAALRHPEAAVFGGRIDVDAATLPGWVRQSSKLCELLAASHVRASDVYEHNRYPFGPNMAVRREAIDRVGATYPEDIGPGTPRPVGDETAFLQRVSPPGARDRRYVGTAVVTHLVDGGALSFGLAVRRSWAQGVAEARFGTPHGDGDVRAGSTSFARRVLRRLGRLRSARELVCVAAQQLAYTVARPGLRKGR